MLGNLKLLHTTVLLCSEFFIENLCTILCALTRLHSNVLVSIFYFKTDFQVLKKTQNFRLKMSAKSITKMKWCSN